MLTCRQERRGAVTVLHLEGNLDALTISDFKQELNTVIAERCTASVIDMAGVTLIDSSGVGGIISFFKRLRSVGGDVKIASLRGQPQEIFRLLGLEKAFELHGSVEEALARFPA